MSHDGTTHEIVKGRIKVVPRSRDDLPAQVKREGKIKAQVESKEHDRIKAILSLENSATDYRNGNGAR